MTNTLRSRLLAGDNAIGTVCTLGSIEAMEIAAAAGLHFILADWQHGSFDRDLMREAVRAMDATDCHAIARPPSDDLYLIQWLLDMGYLSLLIPMVNTPEQARAVVASSYYPPRGERSQATTRAALRHGSDYREHVNGELLVVVMIETVEAVDNIEAIAAIDGITGCFVGGTDLASSMGIKGDKPAPPEFEAAVARVREATVAAGKVAAIAAPDGDKARSRIDEGFDMVTAGSDIRMLCTAMSAAMNGLRE